MQKPDVTVVIATAAADREAALALRRRVFVEEQGVPADLEVDAHEGDATHFLARTGRTALGVGRFRKKGPLLKYERIATLKESRGTGVGRELMAVMEREGGRLYPKHLPYMHAQEDAVPFYEKLGWQKLGARFVEAGIGHYVMVRPPANVAAARALLAWTDPGAPAEVRAWLGRTYGPA